MKKITVGVVLFGSKYLKESLPSLLDQDYPEIEFIFRDQEEGKWSAYEFMKAEMPEVFEKAKVVKAANVWHSGGHNAIIREMSGEIYFCCSNDMLYPRDFVSKMVAAMEARPEFSVAACKVMRWDYDKGEKTEFIDSFGLGVRKYHHFYDIGQGEEDRGQYDELEEIFGVSGALFAVTREALEAIRFGEEYFDELIHYKNDVDLSYRLRWAGERALLVKAVKVYHDRQLSTQTKKSLWMKKASYLGERILMEKNFSEEFPLDLRLKTWAYHFLKKSYLFVTTPQLVSEWRKYRGLRGKIAEKSGAMDRSGLAKNIVDLMN